MKKNIREIKELIKNSSKIIIITGAGISTNCGIPDFRSEKGLYSTVGKKYKLPYPEAIFDIEYFKKEPYPFFNLSKALLSKQIKPSLTHNFIAYLESNNKLELLITQNIDRLHTLAGSKKVIECHGTYEKGQCLKCGKKYKIQDYIEDILNDKMPLCTCNGLIKPNVVFYGEHLPEEFYKLYMEIPKGDLIMVLGSSLTTEPVASLARNIAKTGKSLIVNFHKTIYDEEFDYVVQGDLDEFFSEIWKELK